MHPSPLSDDAVMAVVFFNSQEDYEQAMLDQRATVLDKIAPYAKQSGINFHGSFSIFLIDANNNVFYKSSGKQLPPLEDAQQATKN